MAIKLKAGSCLKVTWVGNVPESVCLHLSKYQQHLNTAVRENYRHEPVKMPTTSRQQLWGGGGGGGEIIADIL